NVHLHDGGSVDQEAAVHNQAYAESVALFFLAPAGFFSDGLQHAAESGGVNGILIVRLSVVFVILRQFAFRKDAIPSQKLKLILERIFPDSMGQFVGEGLNSERIID